MTKKESSKKSGRVAKVLKQWPLPKAFQKEAEKFRKHVKTANHILISSTLTSDGDSVGAQLGILHLIRLLRGKKKVKITVINQSEVPSRYSFLKGASEILGWSQWERQRSSSRGDFDYGIVLDGGIERTGDVRGLFDGLKTALVDHHAIGSRLSYAANLLDLEASSTCEIVYSLYEHFKIPIDRSIAEILYVGIIFDTGFFKHSLTKPKTHVVASQLIRTGFDFSEVADRAILERSWSGQMLLRKLLENMKKTTCSRVVHSSWSKKELEEIAFKDGDQEGMINQMYYTDTAQVVALFVEHGSSEVKISFRSKGKVNVAEFARQLNPDGGGHVRASGCTLPGELQVVREQVIAKLLKLLPD
jgi:phosphoesterase RecJ-like protein